MFMKREKNIAICQRITDQKGSIARSLTHRHRHFNIFELEVVDCFLSIYKDILHQQFR